MNRELKNDDVESAPDHVAKELYQALFEQAADGIFITDAQGRFIEVNQRGCEMLGYTRDEILNLFITDLVSAEELAVRLLQLNELWAGKTMLKERRLRRKDGRLLLVEINARVRSDGSLLGIVRDITERKKAETQILASEHLFRALVENSPDFIARYDREFRRIYVNPAIQKLFGTPIENVLNKTPNDQSPVYAPQVYIDQLRQVIETATECAIEMPFRTAQGEMHWGHMRFVPEFGPDGQVASVLAIGRDIHEIKESERRFRTLAENFPDFIVRFDRDCRLTFVNPAVTQAFGLPAEAFLGKTLPELPQRHKLEQNDMLMALIHRAFDEGIPNNSEAYWDTQRGKRIFEIHHVPEKDATGNVVTVLGIAHDITERKKAEEERLAYLRFLESMDQVNRAIQSTNDLEEMMRNVLDTLLSIFECDRAWLVYPCNPEAATWQTPMERTRPEYPGVLPVGVELPLDPVGAEVFRILRAASGPVQFGPKAAYPIPEVMVQAFNIQSFIALALYPKVGQAWSFGLHQCSYARVWTPEEERLLQEIGRRLADGLTSLLAYRHLQESEEKLRTVFYTVEEALTLNEFVFDDNGEIVDYKILEVNPAFEQDTGLTHEQAVGKKATEIYGMSSEYINAFWKTHLHDEHAIKTEMYIDQIKAWKHISTSKPVDNKFVVSYVDITELKNAEKALRESEKQYRLIAENTADTISVFDLTLKPVYISPSVLRLRGYAVEEAMTQSLDQILTPASRQIANKVFTEQMALEASGTADPDRTVLLELEEYCKDGSIIWVELAASILRDNQLSPTGILTVTRDITERKQMAEALAAQEREFRTLAENSPDNIARYDVDCRTIYVNPTLEKTLRRPASEMLGTTPLEAAFINEYREYQEKIIEVLKTGKNAELDIVMPDMGEGVRFHNIRFVAERGADGVITGVQTIGRDVTDRKRAEEEIRLLNQELEQRVADRTAQLEAANKELEAFAYSVSHDLRAPLRHIDGFLDLLQQRLAGALDNRSQHYMATISNAAKHMGQLIDDLLSFSRMGRFELSKTPVDLSVLVQDIIRDLAPEMQGRTIRWTIANLPTVSGDRAMLRLVLTNLIANALKFTRRRPQTDIEIGCQPGQKEAIIFIRDNGVGFDMAYADKLFGVFQRLHHADEFEGTGIGLANVRRIISRHGGRTWAEGQIDIGATFYFSLPHSNQEALH